MRDHDFLRPGAGAPPDIDGAEKLRMQRAAAQADPKQRHPRRSQPPRQFVNHLGKGTALPGAADEPFEDRFDRIMGRPFCNRALDDLRDDDVRPSTISDEDAVSPKCSLIEILIFPYLRRAYGAASVVITSERNNGAEIVGVASKSKQTRSKNSV